MLCSEEIFNSGENERTIPGVRRKQGESSAWPGVLEDRSGEGGVFLQTVGGGTAVPERVPEPDAGGAAEQDRGLTDGSTLCERRLSGCSLCGIEEEHRAVYDMVQRILLSTRGYVNFVNEVFRQVRACACVCVCVYACVCVFGGGGGSGRSCAGAGRKAEEVSVFVLLLIILQGIQSPSWAELHNSIMISFIPLLIKVSHGGLEFEHFVHF